MGKEQAEEYAKNRLLDLRSEFLYNDYTLRGDAKIKSYEKLAKDQFGTLERELEAYGNLISGLRSDLRDAMELLNKKV